jgi:hypothetical protein
MAKESLDHSTWTLRHRQAPEFKQHNHSPSLSAAAHPIHHQIADNDQDLIKHLSSAGIAPRDISSFLQIKGSSSPNIIQQDIYNYITQGKQDLAKDQSHMHALTNKLNNEGFWSHIKLDQDNRVTHVIFAHPKSLEYLKAYPDIVILDYTYKTNKYRMPLLDIVGVDAC